MTVYFYTTISDPRAPHGTSVSGISSSGGHMVGSLQDQGVVTDGFVYGGEVFSDFADDPGWTSPTGINAAGEIVGTNGQGGFLFDNGDYTYLTHPGAAWTNPHGINDAGQIVGTYRDTTNHGFLYSGGNFITIDAPHAYTGSNGFDGTLLSAINSSGQIVGSYYDVNGASHGFIYDNGTSTTIDSPLAGQNAQRGFAGSALTGINDQGQIVGYYFDDQANAHSFIYSDGSFSPIDHPLATSSGLAGTYVTGIDNSGQVVGSYRDSSNYDYGFFATIDSEPTITSDGGGTSATVSIAENSTAAITTLTATNLEVGQTLSYSIIDGSDASKFIIDPNTGALSFISAPDFEAPVDIGGNNVYDVTVQVSDGNGLTDWQAIAVAVQDVTGVSLTDSDSGNSLIGTVEDDTLNGQGGNDILSGGAGNDILSGGADNDLLDGGIGKDTASGGVGNDLYHVDNAGDLVFEVAGAGYDRVAARVSYVLTAGQQIEVFTTNNSAGTGAIDLTGNEFANTIAGNAGANRLDGRGGADSMQGLGGNDIYLVDNADDQVIEAVGGGNDRVATGVSYVLAAGQEIELFTTNNAVSTSAINLTGNEFANYMIGNAGANTFDGRSGTDTMQGGGGNDLYHVDNAGDMVLEVVGGGFDRVAASLSYFLTVGQEIELFTTNNSAGVGAINLTGNAHNQTVAGNAGNNVLNGGAGNDTLTGLGGKDSFVFNTALNPATNVDTITDFSVVDDAIVLENAVFAGLATGTLSANAFRIGAAAVDTDDRIIYNNATGQLIFDSNGNAAGGATQFATLAAGLALTNADFVII